MLKRTALAKKVWKELDINPEMSRMTIQSDEEGDNFDISKALNSYNSFVIKMNPPSSASSRLESSSSTSTLKKKLSKNDSTKSRRSQGNNSKIPILKQNKTTGK